MNLNLNPSQLKRTSNLCFELSKGLSLLAVGNGIIPFSSKEVLFLNSFRLALAAIIFFYFSLKFLDSGGKAYGV